MKRTRSDLPKNYFFFQIGQWILFAMTSWLTYDFWIYSEWIFAIPFAISNAYFLLSMLKGGDQMRLLLAKIGLHPPISKVLMAIFVVLHALCLFITLISIGRIVGGPLIPLPLIFIAYPLMALMMETYRQEGEVSLFHWENIRHGYLDD